jgi:hypothetical protein
VLTRPCFARFASLAPCPRATRYVDFFDLDGLACPTNAAALRAIWAANTAVGLVMGALAAPKVALRWRQHKELVRSKAGEGGRYRLRKNRGLAACISACCCTLFVLFYGLLQQVRPDSRLGRDLGVTLAFAGGKLTMYGAVWLFQPALLRSLLAGKRATASLVKANDAISLIICCFAGSLGLVPILCLALSDGRDPLAMVCYYVTVGGTLVAIVLLLAQAVIVKRAIVNALDESYSLNGSMRTWAVRNSLVALQNQSIMQSAYQVRVLFPRLPAGGPWTDLARCCSSDARSQSVVLALFLVLPWLMERHAFFTPIGTLAYLVLTKKISDTTIEAERLDAGRAAGSSSSSSDNDAPSQPAGDDASSFSSGQSAASLHAVAPKFEVAVASFREPDPASRGREQEQGRGSV